MTIIEQIKREAEALPSEQRQQALKILRSLRKARPSARKTKAASKTLGEARRTLRAVRGLWRDRADLPADTVEASIELRRRVMRRGKNG